ncbi:uncharacterized protein LY79DRAFT_96259 [Colletotrichum navitas]|uniref:Uncharacterized protein n=1 Tax=Colletotrichum navitas TaxID=681940 RepID=A0AAD8UW84_9PEZI|nr:uncharacterized protein LY79DRAFT_96259 [Colletotrichum navitas]KAK1566417.1 hypothetical protein LY79DRAFT_96259 [Colletotrichum navitas]
MPAHLRSIYLGFNLSISPALPCPVPCRSRPQATSLAKAHHPSKDAQVAGSLRILGTRLIMGGPPLPDNHIPFLSHRAMEILCLLALLGTIHVWHLPAGGLP